MNGHWIDVAAADGSGVFRAYLSLPRAGKGPGLVIAQEIFGVNATMRAVADAYADEGYVVAVPDLFWRLQPGVELGHSPEDRQKAFALYGSFDENKGVADLQTLLTALRERPELVGKAGVLGYCLGGKLAYLAACRTDADVAVGYYGVGIENSLGEAANIKGHLLLHIAALDTFCPAEAQAKIVAALSNQPDIELHTYPDVEHAFARIGGEHFDKAATGMANQRSIAALRGAMGPHYNLSALWDKHCEYEFATRNVPDTMATMVANPYVNHIPTMTGGVGATQVVDEMLFCFTHTCEIDWMLPGIAPTGKRVEIPLVALVAFRGDKLAHEHIYWDQASVLVQIGKLDPAGLPVAGIATAKKLLDETLPSNTLMAAWASSDSK